MLKFKPLYRMAARKGRREGTISREDYDKVMETLRWPQRTRRDSGDKVEVLNSVQDYVYGQMEIEGCKIDWDGVLEWIKEHWVDILKIIITLLVLLEPPPKEK